MKRPSPALWLVLAGIALRAVVPAGYMPAPIAEGLPFVLCPGAVPGLASLAGHGPHDRGHVHGNEEAPPGDSGTWDVCPFGAVFGASILPPELGPLIAWLAAVSPAAAANAFVPSPITRAWRARAPPTDPSIDA